MKLKLLIYEGHQKPENMPLEASDGIGIRAITFGCPRDVLEANAAVLLKLSCPTKQKITSFIQLIEFSNITSHVSGRKR